jgi:hypothetical protein
MFEVPASDAVSEVIRDYMGYAATVDVLMYWDEECCDIYTLDESVICSPATLHESIDQSC